MHNLLSNCGLVDARIRASDKDLPLQKKSTMIVQSLFLSSATSVVILLKPGVIWSIINVWCMKITNQKNAHSAIDDFLQKLYWKNMLCDLIIRKEFCAMIVEKYLAVQNCLKGTDSRRMSYEPIKKWVLPCINQPQILMVCMYTGTKLGIQTKIL